MSEERWTIRHEPPASYDGDTIPGLHEIDGPHFVGCLEVVPAKRLQAAEERAVERLTVPELAGALADACNGGVIYGGEAKRLANIESRHAALREALERIANWKGNWNDAGVTAGMAGGMVRFARTALAADEEEQK